MIRDLITEKTFLEDVDCSSWEECVEIGAGLLVKQGSIQPEFIQSIKDTIATYGSYMVLLDDIAFFHGPPEAGVSETSMSLMLLRSPVYLEDKRIKAAFTFAAVDKDGHLQLLQELAGLLQDDAFLELLRNGGPADQIMNKIKEGAQEE